MALLAGTATITMAGQLPVAAGTGMALRIAQQLCASVLTPAITDALADGLDATKAADTFGAAASNFAGIANAVAAGVVAEITANGKAQAGAAALGGAPVELPIV